MDTDEESVGMEVVGKVVAEVGMDPEVGVAVDRVVAGHGTAAAGIAGGKVAAILPGVAGAAVFPLDTVAGTEGVLLGDLVVVLLVAAGTAQPMEKEEIAECIEIEAIFDLRHLLVWQWIHAVKSKNVTFEFINHVFCANRLSHDTSTHFPIVNISRTKVSSIVLISDRNFRLSKCQTGQTCIMLSDLTWLPVMCVNVIWRVHNNSIIYLQHSRSRL